MKVALVSEGTYPYGMGGVSVWCDQLLRGLSDYRWDMVALTTDGTERIVWDLPDNLDTVHAVPLWSAGSTRGRRRRRRAWPAFAEPYRAFLDAMLSQVDPRLPEAVDVRFTAVVALRGMYDALVGDQIDGMLTTNDALAVMSEAWHGAHPDTVLTLADAAEVAWLMERMLRPLWANKVAEDVDIVHATMNGLSMLVGLAAKWRYDVPLVMSEHGIYLRERYLSYLSYDGSHAMKTIMLGFFRAISGAGYVLADAVAPHSSNNRRWALLNGTQADRLWTMYNGVSLREFPVATSEPTVPTVVFMGRIDPLKDLHTLLKAFAIVYRQMPQARLRIFGGTPSGNEPYHDSCLRLIEELGLEGAATMEGKVGAPVDAYHAASIVALTSISEGFPYTVVEAMACGRSVVCTDVGGVAEAVGNTGYVVTARDSEGVAAACLRLLRHDDERQEMRRAARERVVERFTLERSIEAYRSLYEHLAPRGPIGPRMRRGGSRMPRIGGLHPVRRR